jgi:hypothetical protein
MKLTRKHLVGVATALSTVASAALVSNASAATFPAVAAGPIGAAGSGDVLALPSTGAILGHGVTIVGPVIITTAPTRFNNTNNQVSAVGNWSGGQFGG